MFSFFPLNAKVEDLSRMFRLFSKIPRGLDPVSSIFKQVGGILNYHYAFPPFFYVCQNWGLFQFSLFSCSLAYKMLSPFTFPSMLPLKVWHW